MSVTCCPSFQMSAHLADRSLSAVATQNWSRHSICAEDCRHSPLSSLITRGTYWEFLCKIWYVGYAWVSGEIISDEVFGDMCNLPKLSVVPGHKLKNSRAAHRISIFGWYRLVFSWYCTNLYQRETWLVHFGIKNLARAPFSFQKGGLWTPFLELSPPLLEETNISCWFLHKKSPTKFQKEFLPNLILQKYQPDTSTD